MTSNLRFTIYDLRASRKFKQLVNRKSQIVNEKYQGDHGRCRANYRCCLPALAGFVSPHSMGPGETEFAACRRRFQENSGFVFAWRLVRGFATVQSLEPKRSWF